MKTRRQLIQNWAKVSLQKFCPFQKSLERLLRVFQPFNMGDKAIGFHRVEKIFRCLFVPILEGLLFWQLIESIVNFDSVEVFRIVLKPFAFRQLFRIEPSLPVGVMPAGSAYSNITSTLAHRKYFNTLNNPENYYNYNHGLRQK